MVHVALCAGIRNKGIERFGGANIIYIVVNDVSPEVAALSAWKRYRHIVHICILGGGERMAGIKKFLKQ